MQMVEVSLTDHTKRKPLKAKGPVVVSTEQKHSVEIENIDSCFAWFPSKNNDVHDEDTVYAPSCVCCLCLYSITGLFWLSSLQHLCSVCGWLPVSLWEWGHLHGRNHSRITWIKCTNFNVRETNLLFYRRVFCFFLILFCFCQKRCLFSFYPVSFYFLVHCLGLTYFFMVVLL